MSEEDVQKHAAGTIARERSFIIRFLADTAICTALMWTEHNLKELVSDVSLLYKLPRIVCVIS